MDFSLLKKAIKKIKVKIKKELVVMLFAVAIFLLVLYMVFGADRPTEQDVPNYAELSKDKSAKYKERMTDTSGDIKNLAESDQLKEIKYFKNLIEEKEYKKRNDPFMKPF